MSLLAIALSVALSTDPCPPAPVKAPVPIRHSPKRASSPIIAWVTVRSGRPDAPQCEEGMPSDPGEPVIELPDVLLAMPAPVDVPPEEPVPEWAYTPVPIYPPVLMGDPPRRSYRPPPVSVPEPGMLGLFAFGLLASIVTGRRKR